MKNRKLFYHDLKLARSVLLLLVLPLIFLLRFALTISRFPLLCCFSGFWSYALVQCTQSVRLFPHPSSLERSGCFCPVVTNAINSIQFIQSLLVFNTYQDDWFGDSFPQNPGFLLCAFLLNALFFACSRVRIILVGSSYVYKMLEMSWLWECLI